MSLALSAPTQLTIPTAIPFSPVDSVNRTANEPGVMAEIVTCSIEKRAGEFFSALDSNFVNKVEAKSGFHHFSAVKTLLKDPNFVQKKIAKSFFNKKCGYFSRLFSSESWTEWTEHRTALGRVIGLYSDFIQSRTDLKLFMSRLNIAVVDQAEQEAKLLIETGQQTAETALPSQSDCSNSLIIGGGMSLATRNPLFMGIASLHCLDTVRAFFQGHIIVEPGKNWYGEGDRKVAVCKSGKVAWNNKDTCGYHGPAMEVTVICRQNSQDKILFSGALHGSHQWFCLYGRISIQVENTSSEQSAMYVHVED